MPPAGFEPTIPARKLPQTHALDRAATGIGTVSYRLNNFRYFWKLKVHFLRSQETPSKPAALPNISCVHKTPLRRLKPFLALRKMLLFYSEELSTHYPTKKPDKSIYPEPLSMNGKDIITADV
jgi:hypothetical protein